ncbi:apolipoprotein N-acyltransferase [Marinomonas epiphytica]
MHSAPDLTPHHKLGRVNLLAKGFVHLPKPIQLLCTLLLGAFGVLSFAPFHFWPALLVTLMAFFVLLETSAHAKQAFWRSFCIGLGFFGAGVSWIFISIDEYGQTGSVLAAIITFAFVSLLALFWGVAGSLSHIVTGKVKSLPRALLAPLALLLAEYTRSHIFTGFPWLLAGYGTQHTWLFELLPIGGIWLVSIVYTLSAAVMAHFLMGRHFIKPLTGILIIIWLTSGYLNYQHQELVTQTGELKATLIQGNVKQDEKWLADTARTSLAYYQQETIAHLDSDLVVWPETAITYLYPQIQPHLTSFSQELAEHNTTLITGIPDQDPATGQYFNAIWATGDGFGLYYKQRLVPFGEYIPLASLVGPLLDIFNMPISGFVPGDDNQPALQVREWAAAPFICYEIVYSEQVRNMVRDSDFLITISNDGWFGASIGPWQHLQIAQFRAKEAGRYVVRATNTGLTAIINEQGLIDAQAPQFKQTSLTAQVKTFTGLTPYVQWGNYVSLVLLLFCLLVCQLNFLIRR